MRRELQRLIAQAWPALCEILDSARGVAQAPIRAEIFGLQRMAQHGRSLGHTHRAAKAGFGRGSFFPRLRNNVRTLREAHQYIGTQAATGYDISPAAEWLLDNFHLIEAQLEEVRNGLPPRYFRELPVLVDEPLAGLPRVYGVGWAFVAHTDGAFDDNLLVQFLCAYQESRALNLAEIWALPTTLRVLLIENLRRLAERVAINKAARDVANLCCDRISTFPVSALQQVLQLLERRGVGRVFLAQVAQRLQDGRSSADVGLQAEQQEWLHGALPDLPAVQIQQSADQAADNLSVSNAVNSLRALGDADWPDIVARSSPLMSLMLGSRLFEAEDSGTRDLTLHGIARLALASRRSELTVAQALLDLMHAATGAEGGDMRQTAASHWLQGPGRPTLARALGLHERLHSLWLASARRLALPAYLSTVLLGTLALVYWGCTHYAAAVAEPVWSLTVVGVLMLLPASEALVAVINRIVSESARPTRLQRLALAGGIPAEHRVLVTIPAMLSDDDSTAALAHRLLLHYLANPERHAQFALLTDWADADTAHAAADEALLAGATRCIGQLNLRYPRGSDDAGAAPRFILLHRGRVFCETEQRWIGWERKRGKLEQLIRLLARPGSGTAFVELAGELSRTTADTRYVLSLDSDTQLPPGRLRELVGVAAHPHNRPQLAADRRSVLSGYGILQPRVVTPLPAAKDITRYHWLWAGQCGVDSYSTSTSEVYQDLFGEGSFSGKGLLDVAAMHAVLAGRLPDGRVLSHDLLEGSIARCAAVTDVMVIEEAPFHADVAASRVHRWTRGDWQLLPFLLQPRRYRLRAINCWKMFDNLRRSLLSPMSLALLLLALAGRGVSPWAALALIGAAFCAGPLMGAVAGFSPSRDDLAKRHFYFRAATDLSRTLWAGLWQLAQLLQQARAALDAIFRALYRMGVSHRHLLQWTTAATAQARAATGFAALVRQHALEPVIALLLLGLLLVAGTPHPALAVTLCLLWAASPVWTWWVSRPSPANEEAVLSAADLSYLEGVARDTWHFFERCVGDDDHHLPPDNLQTTPYDIVAHRTSPTNIGLYLLSTACAREFGWIDTAAMLARIEATLATLHGLQRYRGHFLNWYDTQTGAPLLPMYVSTVDSGNLSGHLLALAQACRERAPAPADAARAQRLLGAAEACEALAWASDFGFLYHRRRHLFHIGYRVAEQQLDAGFYDLLASESRLTSLLAIAKGDVPVGHWAALGRPFYALGAQVGLRSWSGSMFEYLMPTLVLDEPHCSALHEAAHAALREQVAFARAHGVPWGISESAYAASDHTLAYQYAPQGVPRLALRRTPPDELVIAPYATALAAQIAPQRARRNFAALQALGARSRCGFIEALDYSPSRQTDSGLFKPVDTFMSHHQGMTVVALANVLLGGVVRRWGMANPRIEAVASLLHERMPREVSLLRAPPSGPPPQALLRRTQGLLREVLPGATALEPTHILSNGRYSVSLRANGAGWSRRGVHGITRWRDDALRDAYGSFCYLRWDQQPRPVSLTLHPAPDPAASYKSTFHSDRVGFDATWRELQAHTTVWVSPEDDIEFRQVEIRNLSDRTLDVELISAFEVTLTDWRADEAHPAFSNLFVQAEWRERESALVFERKPRLTTEAGLLAAHFIADSDPQVQSVRQQVSRQRWLGRHRDASWPLASFDALPAAGACAMLDTGLDPVCVLSVQLRLAPHSKAQVTFATAASDERKVLLSVIDKYRHESHAQRASLMSATLAAIRLRASGLSADNMAAIQSLTTALVLYVTRPPSHGDRSTDAGASVCDRRTLWRLGISGDRPIVLISAGTMKGVGMLRALAQALRMWAWGNVACDLVVLNAEPASYQMALQREVTALHERHAADCAMQAGPSQTGFHVLRTAELSADESSTLHALARVRLRADDRPLLHHIHAWTASHEAAFDVRHETSSATLVATPPATTLEATPQGEFVPGSGEFRFDVGDRLRPDRPWVNVLSNPNFGALISEAGGGYTWALNSRLNQLTAWSNDALSDPPSEWFLLQDRKTREVWSVTPRAGALDYHVVHGQGSSAVSHRRGNLSVTATWCVDAQTSVKQVQIRLANQGQRTLHLRVIGIAEWLMGASRIDRATVHTALFRQRLPEAKLSALMCTQREHASGFGDGTAFLALAGDPDETEDWTCDRRELFDARGRFVLPDHFGQRAGGGLDPCAAQSVSLLLAAGEEREQVFLLGYAGSPDAAQQLATEAAAGSAAARLEHSLSHWNDLLGKTEVKTPDPLFDAMVNRWLLYQAVSCRLWAKAGFYQAGGATGFRDQLQDAMALAWSAPQLLRSQIVLAASRQFHEGDVQHWWHTPGGAGVRTHFSDDLLWLPHACSHYLHATGDVALLDERVPFIEGAAIAAGAEDAYYTPGVSTDEASVYEHAARSIDRSLRVGVHGLPLMGTGDWNDGMNRVGHQGRGESVWLGWFLCRVVADFAPLARVRGDAERAQRWQRAAAGWKAALSGAGWDGQWFRRAYFDDGQPLGTHANAEARIDLIAQAWAVLSGAAPPALQRMAMAAVQTHLVDAEAGLIKLLDPPLVHAVPSAGYIQAYPPGVRENGGQYSHGAVWALMAQAEYATHHGDALDAGDLAYQYFTYLSPAHRSQHASRGAAYGAEPYVMAGDVYSQAPYVGRAGWSWYTGAAAWMHRAAIESIFGLRLGAQDLSFTPCLPSHWPEAQLTLARDGRTMRFILIRASADAALDAAAGLLAGTAAQIVRPGQALRWTVLAPHSCFVVPLLRDGARVALPTDEVAVQ
jgi:cyclic beta-1,2-glucan synthetase